MEVTGGSRNLAVRVLRSGPCIEAHSAVRITTHHGGDSAPSTLCEQQGGRGRAGSTGPSVTSPPTV